LSSWELTSKSTPASSSFFEDQEIKVDYEPGSAQEVELHDGSRLILRKLAGHELDVGNADQASSLLRASKRRGEFLTRLLHWNPNSQPLNETRQLTDQPLNAQDTNTRPSPEALAKMLKKYQT
jgi:2-oxoglutarate ferredoxin oxidoreductase subunit beta